MTDEKDISPMVQKVLDNVENQDYDKDQLMNLYNNATNYEKISDFERETLTEKLVAKLKTKYPSQSARMFGNKSTVAQETLTQILEDIKGEFDWITNNQVKPHVKVGGSMVGGGKYFYRGWNE